MPVPAPPSPAEMAADPRDPQLCNVNTQPAYQQQVNAQNTNRLSTDSTELKRLSQLSTTSSKKTKAHVGPWRLGRTLGRGSSGRVRLAKNTTTGQLAAVKIVPKSVVPSPKYGIEREVIIMKLIEHPNVMALYDVWENKGELYLILEYIEGGELFDYLIKKGRLEEQEAVNYFRQIINGVDYCHRFNICHRDLKPENLLLDKNRNIKIADFGMAALETSDRMLETSCGSPHYASPEIVGGKSYHGAPSDIWSCGIILFALLTGHLPFDDDNIRKLLYKVQEGKFHMPPDLSPQAKDLIWRMLKVKPEDRIMMSDILEHPLLRKYPAKLSSHGRSRSKVPIDPELVAKPVHSQLDVDPEILKNLQTLWHGVSTDIILQKLLSDEPNSEKTFYCLLLKYRHDHSETTTVPKKKKMPNSTSSNYLLQSNASPRRSKHRRTSSGGSPVVRRPKSRNTRGRNASRSRSHSRTRSHSRIIYPHTRSASKSSIVSSSSHRRHSSNGSNGHTRTKSNSSIVSCSPPPPLPSEAVKMVEAELRQQQADNQESSDFVSMLEQAFNFDKKQAANSRALSNPINHASTAYSEPNRRVVSEPHKDYDNHDVPPKLTKSPTYQYSSSFDTSSVREIPPPGTPPIMNAASTTTLPLKNNSDVYLPIELEEDRFADAIEEEMDLHLKKSFDYTKTHQHYLHQQQLQHQEPQKRQQQPQQHRSEFERVRSPGMLSQTKFGDNSELYKSLNFPETPIINRDTDDGFQQHILRLPSSENPSTKRSLTRSGDSRLHISSLLKTDSFNTINEDNKRPKSMLAFSESSTFNYPSRSSIGHNSSSMLLEPTYRYSSSATLLTNSNNPRHSAPSNILLNNNNNNSRRYEEGIQEVNSRSNSPNKLRAVSAYERTTTSATGVRQLPATGQHLLTSQMSGAGLNSSKGGSSLFRKFSLTPKRAAPAAPVNGHPQQPVTLAGGDTYDDLNRIGNNSGSAPKSRIISHSETIKTTTTRATSGTTWKSTASSRMTSTASTPATVSAPTYDQPEVLKMPVSKQNSGPKQNWFMKMLKTVRSETKGYYSSYSAGTLRRMIVQILVEWQRYGISNISEDTTTSTIRAKISSRNVLSLRSSKFRIEIETHSVRSSYYTKPQYLGGGDSATKGTLTSIVIVQERGPTSSFLRFLGELEKALDDRDALIMREGQTFQGTNSKMLDNPLGIYA